MCGVLPFTCFFPISSAFSSGVINFVDNGISLVFYVSCETIQTKCQVLFSETELGCHAICHMLHLISGRVHWSCQCVLKKSVA